MRVHILNLRDLTFYTSPNTLYVTLQYGGADKSLARPGRKQVTTTEDFDVHISYL